MNSLVSADYGSGSSDECHSDDEYHINSSSSNPYKSNGNNLSSPGSDPDSDDSDELQGNGKATKPVLPSASSILLKGGASTGQVFNNPYKKAEVEQIASLEKHVKMVDSDAHTQMKNGKKICWNYRKGRCRFGSNCTYAHDSDLHVDNDNAAHDAEQTPSTAVANNTTATITNTTTHTFNKATASNKKQKRPGLGDSIIPSKKVIKSYNALKK